jgi:hypothetical protein
MAPGWWGKSKCHTLFNFVFLLWSINELREIDVRRCQDIKRREKEMVLIATMGVKGVTSDLQTVICKFQLDAMQRQSPHHRRCGREVPSDS